MEGGQRGKEGTKEKKVQTCKGLVKEREPNKEGKPGRQNKQMCFLKNANNFGFTESETDIVLDDTEDFVY